MRFAICSTLVLPLALLGTPAFADNVSGTFKAVSSCDAYKSFRHGTNPGLVRTVPGAEYEAVEVNSKDMDWVRIRMPNVSDPLRWVAGSCGTKDFAEPGAPPPPPEPGGKGKECHTKNKFESYVLAMSWQPGFCEHASYRGVKPECEALRNGDMVIEHLTLHGLWPNRKACGTKYNNCDRTPLDLDEATVSQLSPWMPNFFFEQTFGNHEWSTHGTCQSLPDDQYFLTAIRLVQAVDNSSVGSYIKSREGGSMSAQKFFAQVAADYGQEVADRINLQCAEGQYLQEVRINLPQVLSNSTDLKELTAGAPKSSDGRTSHCNDDNVFIERSGVQAVSLPPLPAVPVRTPSSPCPSP